MEYRHICPVDWKTSIPFYYYSLVFDALTVRSLATFKASCCITNRVKEGDTSTSDKEISVDDRLGLNRFEIDEEPFITVETELCRLCELKPCLYVCPAQVYRWEDGQLIYNIEGCLELGACEVVCHTVGRGAIRWNYPRGGKGVQFSYG